MERNSKNVVLISQRQFKQIVADESELLKLFKVNKDKNVFGDEWKLTYLSLIMFSISILQWGVFNNDKSHSLGLSAVEIYVRKIFPSNKEVIKSVKDLIDIRCKFAHNNFNGIADLYERSINHIEVLEFLFSKSERIVSQKGDIVIKITE